MDPEQYKILKEVHESTIRLEERFKHVDERDGTRNLAIIDLAKSHYSLKGKVEADRNKVFGALWVFGSALFSAVVAFIISLFKHS